MNPPSAQTLLAVWERGLRSSPVQRALLLLSAAHSNSLEHLAQLPIGERNKQLVKLRQHLFGSNAEAVVDCPRCQERLEFSLPLPNLISETLVSETTCEENFSLRSGAYKMQFRLLNSLDLLDLPNEVMVAREVLLGRCLLGVQHKGKPVAAKDIPEPILAKLSEQMAKVDPNAVMELRLECPACKHSWIALFDIARFLWSELDHWAKHMLLAIHCLASAYGWSEADILGLSAWRRQAYLEMLS
ncbi:MAG: phage baseplate protein [Trueperaceae bacterium]